MTLAATLAPLLSYAFLTEEQYAIIAEASKPDKTQAYVQKMKQSKNVQINGVDRTNWTAKADSSETGSNASLAIDSSPDTFWETEIDPVTAQFPHHITIDMKQNYWVSGVTYLPRQDGQLNGTIGRHIIQLSTDGKTYGKAIAFGLWHDDNGLKTANFSTAQARYIRLRALTESGDRGPWTTAADINIYAVPSYTPPNPSVQGAYGPTLGFPTVLVAVTVLHGSGKVMGWSSFLYDQFTGGGVGTTWTTTYDPAAGVVSDAVISDTQHDMFCPGLSRDALGRAIVSGGNSDYAVSMYDDTVGNWTVLPQLNIPRGYQGQTTLSTGEIFTIGGSFSGGQSYKEAEVFSHDTNAWRLMSGCPVQPMLTADAAGIYRADNHGWLFGWSNGSVFQAGPSKAMNWYTTAGNGTTTPAGPRGNDGDAMCGNAVIYDAVQGLMLTVGGSTNYDNTPATSNANIITIPQVGQNASVQQIGNMHYPRTFANSVALPNGQVLVAGGQEVPVVFTDTTPVMIPELFDPTTLTFTEMAPLAAVRNYHSVALLLPDASVLIGGGGLCGSCNTNKFDAQIFYPPYFYTAAGGATTRPVIRTISTMTLSPGQTLTITTNIAITQVSLMRYGSATHALDTDQRRVPLTPKVGKVHTYTVTIPNDSGIMIPGAWMVFALANGVPSVSKTVMLTT